MRGPSGTCHPAVLAGPRPPNHDYPLPVAPEQLPQGDLPVARTIEALCEPLLQNVPEGFGKVVVPVVQGDLVPWPALPLRM